MDTHARTGRFGRGMSTWLASWKRPPGRAIRGGRGVSRHRRESTPETLARAGGRRNTAVDFDAINAAAMACLPALCRAMASGRTACRPRVGGAQSVSGGSATWLVQGEPQNGPVGGLRSS